MRFFPLLLLCAATMPGAVPVNGESLQYTINWPSGLSLGEGKITANQGGEGLWNFTLQFEAALPGFAIADQFRSTSNEDQCSLRFEKELIHGRRKSSERVTFESGRARRETVGGGKSEFNVPACARDALSFIFHLRKELSQGRVPSAQDVIYGSPYRVRLQFGGTQRVKVGEAMEQADRILASVKGPSSEFDVEIFFSKDDARTPLLVKLPLSMGSFSMELVR